MAAGHHAVRPPFRLPTSLNPLDPEQFIEPGLATQTATAFDPTVVGEEQVTPGLAQQLAVTFDPVITTGPVSVFPGTVDQTAQVFDPVVRAGADHDQS